jgi:hypothetical protein
MSYYLKKKTHKKIYFTILILFLFFTSIITYTVGFLTTDSRQYLELAKSISEGKGMNYKGEYWAAWPFGYPALISLIYKLGNFYSYLLASKITNFFCLFVSFFFVKRIFLSLAVTTLFIINPVVLKIYSYTWSENLFLLATCGVILQLKLIGDEKINFNRIFLLTFFLILGCLSRYPFAPFAFFIWISFYICYGKKIALKLLPCFIITAIFFILYLFFNYIKTGYPTGIYRVSSHESFFYLLIYFLRSVIENSFLLIVNIFIFYFVLNNYKIFFIKNLTTNIKNSVKKFNLKKNRIYYFIILVGISYLFLAFILRVYTWYDKYDARTIGYGLVFLFSGISSLIFYKNYKIYSKITYALSFSCIFVFLTSHEPSKIYQIIKVKPFESAESLIARDKSTGNHEVYFTPFGINSSIQNIHPFFQGGDPKYYGENSIVEQWRLAPMNNVENYQLFVLRIKKYSQMDCVFDFTYFKDEEFLNQKLNHKLAIDIKFSISKTPVKIVYMDLFDPEVKKFIYRAYVAESFISCKEALQKNYF